MLRNEFNGGLARYTAKVVISEYWVVFFSNKICTFCAFYRPRANFFCSEWRNSRLWRDSRVIFMQSEVSIHAISNNLIVATQAWTWVIKSKTSLSYSFCSILLQNIALVFAARDGFFWMNTFNLTEETSYVAFLNHTTSSRRCSLYAGQGITDLIKLSVKDFKESFPSLL